MITKKQFLKKYKSPEKTLEDIAAELKISVSTVKNYASKFNVSRGKGFRKKIKA